MIVTGPSFHKTHLHICPEDSRFHMKPGLTQLFAEIFIQPVRLRGRCRAEIVRSVALLTIGEQRELRHKQYAPADIGDDRFILPLSSSKMRSFDAFAASVSASASVSPFATPSRINSPCSHFPTTLPSTETDASRHLCRIAFIICSNLSMLTGRR